jgi:hypothetical protein
MSMIDSAATLSLAGRRRCISRNHGTLSYAQRLPALHVQARLQKRSTNAVVFYDDVVKHMSRSWLVATLEPTRI